jgi:poly [ADP-ribose] polymerase
MTPEIKSDLNPKVQDLIRTIFDMKMMNNQMKEIGYDAKKMPLGKLAKSSIMKGYNALKGLMD